MIKEKDISYYIGLFHEKYLSSKSFITYIEEFGSILVSLVFLNNNVFVYCRSILGLIEFEFTNNFETDKEIVIFSLDTYFRHFVHNWDVQINTRSNFFDNVFSFLTSNIGLISTNNRVIPLIDIIRSFISSNINDFKIDNLKKRISELNFFYVEEIENFILRDFIEIDFLDIKIEDINHFNDILVDSEEIENLNIQYKNVDSGELIIIKEFISTEISVLVIMNKMYYEGILIQKERIEQYKYFEYFKDFETLYFLSKQFVKDLLESFSHLKSENINLKHNFINSTDIKNFPDLQNIFSKLDTNLDLTEIFSNVLFRNLDYFNSYKRFVISQDSIVKNCKLKNISIEKLRDTFNVVIQRLLRYDPLITRLLSFTDKKSLGYNSLKIFLIKIKKFLVLLDKLQDIQFKKEKTWELCIKYNLDDVKDLYVDEITSGKYKFILIADYILIINLKGQLIDAYNVKSVDIYESGKSAFFIITNRNINIDFHYIYEKREYKMYVIKCKCLSEGIRDRFVLNVRRSIKKYRNKIDINKKIEKGNDLYFIPTLYQKDKEWILLKYKFIMEEILSVNENLRLMK